MRADRRQEDAWNGRVSERAAGREAIRRGACWSRDDAAVRLDNGEELVIAVELEVRDVRRRAAVDDELVEHFELLAFDHFGCNSGG